MTIKITLRNLGELKRAIKTADDVFVWSDWSPRGGDYLRIQKGELLRWIGTDIAIEGEQDDVIAWQSGGAVLVGGPGYSPE